MNHPSFQQLEGEQLAAVTFVQDYIQLHFDGPCINVYAPIVVEIAGAAIRSGELEFRNALCEQIAKTIQSVFWKETEALRLTFADGSRIVVSLRAGDYPGPEALYAHGFGEAPAVAI